MNEPLISPMVKPNISSSPALLPTPLKPVSQSFSEKQSPIAADSFISSAIFTSPLQNMPSEEKSTKDVKEQKPNDDEEPTKDDLTHLDSINSNESKDTRQSNGSASNQSQNGALAAASALLMIRQ